MGDGTRVGAVNAFIAREVHGALHRRRAPTGTLEFVSRNAQLLLDLNEVERDLLEFIKQHVKPSRPTQSIIARGFEIISIYKKCHKIESLDASHLESAKTWIREKKFICHNFGGIFSHAFPHKNYEKLSLDEVEDIIKRIREAKLPENVVIDTSVGGTYPINNLGFIGMTRKGAIKFMQEILPEYGVKN